MQNSYQIMIDRMPDLVLYNTKGKKATLPCFERPIKKHKNNEKGLLYLPASLSTDFLSAHIRLVNSS